MEKLIEAIILVCSLEASGTYGCGPRTAQERISVGSFATEFECISAGNERLRQGDLVDTKERYYRAICVKQ